MELKDRLQILISSAQIVQSKGVLSLDDAVLVKSAIDHITNNNDINTGVKILIKTAELGQSKGCFTLKDAYVLYIAIEGLVDALEQLKEQEKPESTEDDDKSENEQ